MTMLNSLEEDIIVAQAYDMGRFGKDKGSPFDLLVVDKRAQLRSQVLKREGASLVHIGLLHLSVSYLAAISSNMKWVTDAVTRFDGIYQ